MMTLLGTQLHRLAIMFAWMSDIRVASATLHGRPSLACTLRAEFGRSGEKQMQD